MGRQHRLDLHGVHVVAAAHVHLFRSPGETQATRAVDPSEVTGADEAVVGQRLGSEPGCAPIPVHHRRRPQAHLADPGDDVAQLEVDPGMRAAHRNLGVVRRRIEGGADADPGFGARVADGNRRSEPLPRLPHERGCGRSATHHDRPH
jgi:hypothetical protein